MVHAGAPAASPSDVCRGPSVRAGARDRGAAQEPKSSREVLRTSGETQVGIRHCVASLMNTSVAGHHPDDEGTVDFLFVEGFVQKKNAKTNKNSHSVFFVVVFANYIR